MGAPRSPKGASVDLTGFVCVAAFAGSHGVRGDVKVKSFTGDPEAFADYGPLTAEDGRRFTMTALRSVKGFVLARVRDHSLSREDAEALKGLRLYVPREALPAPEDEDEFYHADLIGLGVLSGSGERLGRVTAVQDFGAGDLLEIRLEPPAGGAERPRVRSVFVPFTREAVPHVDLKSGTVTVVPPEGLWDDAPGDAPADAPDEGAKSGKKEGRDE